MHRAAGGAFVLAAWMSMGSPAVRAQSPSPSPSPSVSPCLAPEYRQFDFWVGDWDVLDPAGNVVGTNKVTREYDGCVVQEHWEARGPQKQVGSSFNTYNPGTRQWHQTWVDTSGTLLSIEGQLVDGSMRLQGQTTGSDGTVTLHRITWTPNADGSVRQLWESTDAKGEWSVAFDGKYTRK